MFENYISENTATSSRGQWGNGRHFADDIFKCIFLNKNAWISTKISLKFVSGVPINDIPALVQIRTWHLPGDKPLSEPIMVRLPTHICITRPQWVKDLSTWNHLYMYQHICAIGKQQNTYLLSKIFSPDLLTYGPAHCRDYISIATGYATDTAYMYILRALSIVLFHNNFFP